jgi:hypothetical protein
MGDPKAKAALYVMPSTETAGSLVRNLDKDMALTATGHLAFPREENFIHAKVAASASLLRLLPPLNARGGKVGLAAFTELFDMTPHGTHENYLVRLEPALGLPIELIPAYDKETGEACVDMRYTGAAAEPGKETAAGGGKKKPQPTFATHRKGTEAGEALTSAPKSDGKNNNKAAVEPKAAAPASARRGGRKNTNKAHAAPAQPAGGPAAEEKPASPHGSRKWIDALPRETKVIFDLHRRKSGASGKRWALYSKATNLGEMEDSEPDKKTYLDDMLWDLSKGIARLPEHQRGLEGIEVLTAHIAPDLDHLAAQVAALQAEAHQRYLDTAAEKGHKEESEQERAIAERCTTMRKILEYERLEGPGGPANAGSPGQMAAILDLTSQGTNLSDLRGMGFGERVGEMNVIPPGGEVEDVLNAAPANEDDGGTGMDGMGWGECTDEVFIDVAIPPNVNATEGASGGATAADPAGAALGRAPIKGVKQAMQHPQWGIIKAAIETELNRVMVTTFPGRAAPTMSTVPYSQYQKELKEHGPDLVQLKHLVMPIRAKFDPDGSFIKVTARVTYGDITRSGKCTETFNANVDTFTIKLFGQGVVETPLSRIDIKDVSGAYYHGDPPAIGMPGGRSLYAYVPPGWEQFGVPERDPVTGERNLLHIDGNLPGRQEAGATWGKVYTDWMVTDCGFHQSCVDRQLFILNDNEGKLALACGIHVDDSMTWVCNERMFDVFEEKWIAKFGGARSPRTRLAPSPFLGLLYTQVSDVEMQVTSPRLFDELDRLTAEANEVKGAPEVKCECSAPLPGKALDLLAAKGPEVPPGASWE